MVSDVNNMHPYIEVQIEAAGDHEKENLDELSVRW